MPSKFDHLGMSSPVKLRLQVRGAIPEAWMDCLGGLTVSTTWEDQRAPRSLLTGTLPDQPAVMGLLSILHDLGLPLVLLEVEEPLKVFEKVLKEHKGAR